MSTRDELINAMVIDRAGANRLIDTRDAEVRRERDAEIIAWLIKKAHEYSTSPSRWESVADAIARLASKIDRGAVRSGPAAGKDTCGGSQPTEGESTHPDQADHEHRHQDFGPRAGRRCVTCNRPWFGDAR